MKPRSHYHTLFRTLCCYNRPAAFIGLMLCLPAVLQAAFVTDKIVAEVRSERFGQGTLLKSLPSGSSVEVLVADGKYSRIRTADNVTGWINSTFLTNEKPTQLEYLELLAASKLTEARLRELEEQLASSAGNNSAEVNDEEIEALKKQAQDARWMKIEMMKARDRADQAEAKLKSLGQQTGDSQKTLEKLRTQNQDLEQRLAAALLVNEQQETTLLQTASAATLADTSTEPASPAVDMDPPVSSGRWSVAIEWFLGGLFSALLIGFVAGLLWLDRRLRRRHGGFRIY
ncbi:MAG: TIGR04211 family SH3 domain-containing protein [Gammaproteobacteria bacterium]|nr:TIGR04211 family SH3 domain-containing protein [Gammaproteobacteria bacterium]